MTVWVCVVQTSTRPGCVYLVHEDGYREQMREVACWGWSLVVSGIKNEEKRYIKNQTHRADERGSFPTAQ